MEDLDAAFLFERREQVLCGTVPEGQRLPNLVSQPFRVRIAVGRRVPFGFGKPRHASLFEPRFQVVILLAETQELAFNLLAKRRWRLLPPEQDLTGQWLIAKEEIERASVGPSKCLKQAETRLAFGVFELRE